MVLDVAVLSVENRTYKPPKAKIIINPIFCFLGRFRLFNTGIGRTISIKSVKILKVALKNQINFLEIH